eukprot:1147953-Pelagomonas_calceolata.AAC.1
MSRGSELQNSAHLALSVRTLSYNELQWDLIGTDFDLSLDACSQTARYCSASGESKLTFYRTFLDCQSFDMQNMGQVPSTTNAGIAGNECADAIAKHQAIQNDDTPANTTFPCVNLGGNPFHDTTWLAFEEAARSHVNTP